MTTRARFSEIKERLQPGAWAARVQDADTLYVGSCYDSDYAKAFKSRLPAVWVIGQSSYAIGNEEGQGYAGRMRLRTRIEFALRLVVKRNAAGLYNNEDAFNDLYDAVTDRLFSWLPNGAESECFFVSSEDGPANETFMVADVIFGYVVIKQSS